MALFVHCCLWLCSGTEVTQNGGRQGVNSVLPININKCQPQMDNFYYTDPVADPDYAAGVPPSNGTQFFCFRIPFC